MNKTFLFKTTTGLLLFILSFQNLQAQCNYLPATTTTFDTVSFAFSGGTFASFGCAPIDPTYWLAGNGSSVTVNFVNPQSYPTFRVWGMNTDDSASVTLNGASYLLNQSSASYDVKVVCGLSPGPDGVAFANGKLVGANTPVLGNYSYQNVQLIATNVNTFTVSSVSGAGWGFAGASVNCPLQTSGITELQEDDFIMVYPNPGYGEINIESNKSIDEMMLTDLAGRVVLVLWPNASKILLNSLVPGIYFIRVRSDEHYAAQKLVICKL